MFEKGGTAATKRWKPKGNGTDQQRNRNTSPGKEEAPGNDTPTNDLGQRSMGASRITGKKKNALAESYLKKDNSRSSSGERGKTAKKKLNPTKESAKKSPIIN